MAVSNAYLRQPLKLSFYFKSIAAARAHNRVLSLCAGETENGAAFWTFAVNVSLSVAVHIVAELEKSAEFFILGSAF